MNDMTVAQPINGSRGATVAGPRNIPSRLRCRTFSPSFSGWQPALS
jgi:hypothetical protein